ncbi:hypothetical protein [Leptolyngbya sp. FACHB-8]|uniref:hypothetical protein n=1 Tax=unclassified Leptolyngbya TaxID=2650499 RepID=UPI0016898252|nr:hypothetical protein [Leptolyngbya sp. FACHB-8]MBD1910275.1 hypothetical protein [Leptolyngbya sp. FACHB-8]
MTAFQVGDRVLTRCGPGTIQRINPYSEPVVRGDGDEDSFTFYGTFHPDEVQLLEQEAAA